MASRPKSATDAAATRPSAPERNVLSETRERDGGTREAVRRIVRRYRETFERLGR